MSSIFNKINLFKIIIWGQRKKFTSTFLQTHSLKAHFYGHIDYKSILYKHILYKHIIYKLIAYKLIAYKLIAYKRISLKETITNRHPTPTGK